MDLNGKPKDFNGPGSLAGSHPNDKTKLIFEIIDCDFRLFSSKETISNLIFL